MLKRQRENEQRRNLSRRAANYREDRTAQKKGPTKGEGNPSGKAAMGGVFRVSRKARRGLSAPKEKKGTIKKNKKKTRKRESTTTAQQDP